MSTDKEVRRDMRRHKHWRRALFTLRRDDQNRATPWLDWYLARLVGAALAWLGMRALDRGDVHEFNHALAAIKAGNTDGDHDDCPLDTEKPLLVREFTFAVNADDFSIMGRSQ
jgi:hypothetical protein